MNEFLTKCQELQEHNGNYSINTILAYWEYYLKYDYYIRLGHSKMEAYEATADDCGASSIVIMRAIKLLESVLS